MHPSPQTAAASRFQRGGDRTRPLAPPSAREGERQKIVKLVWIYLWILILEGSIRKWVFPQFSNGLILLRDPVVLLIYAMAIKSGFLGGGVRYMVFFFLSGLLILLGFYHITQGIPLTLVGFGLRCYLFYVPLAMILPHVLTEDDVLNFGKWLIYISVPMTVLMLVQYLAPRESFINAATGDEFQITALGERIRPPGTFSFIVGAAMFHRAVFAFIVYAVVSGDRRFSRQWLIASSAAVMAAAMVSSSRGFILTLIITLIFALPIVMRTPRLIPVVLASGLAFALIGLAVVQLGVVREGLDMTIERWIGAAETETGYAGGNWLGRVLVDPIKAVEVAGTTPLLGYGIGSATNAGFVILGMITEWAEWEWPRMVTETGPVVGAFMIALRVVVAVLLGKAAWDRLQQRRYLGWIMYSTVALDIVVGQLKQNTVLGFLALFVGMTGAALKISAVKPIPAARGSRNAPNARRSR